MTEQQISATVLAGPFIIDYSEQGSLVITDTRGGNEGWVLTGNATSLYSNAAGSAPGCVIAAGSYVVKNSEVGAAGSTGGVWVIGASGPIVISASGSTFTVQPGGVVRIYGDEITRV